MNVKTKILGLGALVATALIARGPITDIFDRREAAREARMRNLESFDAALVQTPEYSRDLLAAFNQTVYKRVTPNLDEDGNEIVTATEEGQREKKTEEFLREFLRVNGLKLVKGDRFSIPDTYRGAKGERVYPNTLIRLINDYRPE